MMMMEEEFRLEDDLSLLCLSSPPYDYSLSHSRSVSTEASPFKRSSPVSDESDQHKRRRISPQSPIFINSPLRFIYPETQSSSIDPTREPSLTGAAKISPARQETTTFCFNTPETEKKQKMGNDREEQEEECGEGMRIERSGEGFIIRLKCRCKLAFRVLFSDHHLYFKPL